MSCFSAIWENCCSEEHASDEWLFVRILLRCPAETFKGIGYRSGEPMGALPLHMPCSVWAVSLPYRFVCVGVVFQHKQSSAFLTECTWGEEKFIIIFDVCMNSVFRCFWGQWKELHVWKNAARKEKLNKDSWTLVIKLLLYPPVASRWHCKKKNTCIQQLWEAKCWAGWGFGGHSAERGSWQIR